MIAEDHDNEFNFGRMFIIVGLILLIVPYLGQIGFIVTTFGTVLVLVSKESNVIKSVWIIPPAIIVGILYFIFIYS